MLFARLPGERKGGKPEKRKLLTMQGDAKYFVLGFRYILYI